MVKSRFEKNKDMTVNLELQVYSNTYDFYMLTHDDDLKKLQEQYHTFTLKIIDSGRQWFIY